MTRYRLTITRADGWTKAIDWVLGVEVEGDTLLFWFEPSKIKTAEVLKAGDSFRLDRFL